MEIKQKSDYGVVATTISNVNNNEMRTMCSLKEKIENVLNTHKDGQKKEYLSDDDLLLLHAVLHVFTRDFETNSTNAFEDALKELNS